MRLNRGEYTDLYRPHRQCLPPSSSGLDALDPSLANQAYYTPEGNTTSATPEGLSHQVEILASGATPGVLEPGESETVPVYYDGWQQPWDFSYPPINFVLGVVNPAGSATLVAAISNANVIGNTQPVNWSSQQAGLRPPSIDTPTWDAIFPNLENQLGTTWGDFVSRLDQDASYLGRLGEDVTDVGQLMAFEIQQAIGLRPYPRSRRTWMLTCRDRAWTSPSASRIRRRSSAATRSVRSVWDGRSKDRGRRC